MYYELYVNGVFHDTYPTFYEAENKARQARRYGNTARITPVQGVVANDSYYRQAAVAMQS